MLTVENSLRVLGKLRCVKVKSEKPLELRISGIIKTWRTLKLFAFDNRLSFIKSPLIKVALHIMTIKTGKGLLR